MSTIQVTQLGKAYKDYPGRWSRLAEWLMPHLGPRHQLRWVLRDIGFQVESGQSVGIIGVNGAGKSTLLKLITGTIQATTGTVDVQGRVAALLELGMGFHPEFTGRQNVFMAGQLAGLSVEEIAALMPHIESFAEIGDYIDQPLRVYSSGMQMRLAFSVATARRPDILIVDEALSVGDDYFQHKSFDRIRDFRQDGTTLLIVSHSKQAIQSICDRVILIDNGCLIRDGDPETVFDFYNALLADRANQNIEQRPLDDGRVQTQSGTGEARVIDIALLNEQGDPVSVVDVGDRVRLRVRVFIKAPIPRLVLGYLIKDRFGQAIFGTNTYYMNQPVLDAQPGEHIDYHIEFPAHLGPGSYSVTLALHDTHHHLDQSYEWRDRALVFNVVNIGHATFTGCNWIEPEIQIARCPAP